MPSTPSSNAAELDAQAIPAPVTDLCAHLEERGIKTWLHGDGLLDGLAAVDRLSAVDTLLAVDGLSAGHAPAWGSDRKRTHSLLCEATGEDLLRALPNAVVTTANQARLTQATEWGPVDLIPLGDASLSSTLSAFGFSALAFAFRPAKALWADVEGALEKTQRGILDLAQADSGASTQAEGNAFAQAPRRYWIAARLIGEYGLKPSDALLQAAQRAFPEVGGALPLGASARRMVDRALASTRLGPASPSSSASAASLAVAFLREAGVTSAVFPGAAEKNEALIGALPPLQSVRWAAWLRGSATQRGLVRMRTPHALARRVERVQEAHPLDRSVASLREASIRRILNRLEADELDALFVWRRLELESETQDGDAAEARRANERLDALETRIAATRAGLARTGIVRALALDGAGVMEALAVGPGRHIGLALAHLASFIETHPEKNESAELKEELRDWASRNPQKIS